MNKCKNCIHWEHHNSITIDRVCGYSHPWHSVTKWELPSDGHEVFSESDGDSGLESVLITGPDFGCVKFEEKTAWMKHIDNFWGDHNMEKTSFQLEYQSSLPKWISIDEEKPQLDKRVLGLMNGSRHVLAVRDEEGIWDEEGFVEFGDGVITHWMPLPPAPGWG